MRKRRGNTILDIIIAVMFISTVLYFCYVLATSSINKRHQINLEAEATLIAENIMNRVLSKGVYMIKSEPIIDTATLNKINNLIVENNKKSDSEKKTQSELNKELVEIGGRLPVDRELDAPFLKENDEYENVYSYQVIVDNYMERKDPSSTDYIRYSGLKRITVNVYYPVKILKYAKKGTGKKDTSSLEEEYSVVTLTTYKSVREYEHYD